MRRRLESGGMNWILAIVALVVYAVCLVAFHIRAARDFHRITNWWEHEDDFPPNPEDLEHK
ncbi:MAG TPA: hypothetical protein VGI40_18265 [Pirellulaceae bacterium]